MTLSAVVFPLPIGPITIAKEPLAIGKLTLLSTTLAFDSSCTVTLSNVTALSKALPLGLVSAFGRSVISSIPLEML